MFCKYLISFKNIHANDKVDFTLNINDIENKPSILYLKTEVTYLQKNTVHVKEFKDNTKYKKQYEEMAAALSIPLPEDWYSVLLRLPDAIKSEAHEALAEDESAALVEAVSKAVEELMQFRAVEGRKLEDFFTARIDNIRNLLAEVPQYEGERVAKIRARIEEGLAKLGSIDYDKSRLEQEMIFYIEKLDVNEEKQRLAQHLNYFMETMATGQGQGKKLGFISQEMGREINTLGSKSNHAEMQKLVVKMKDELEQIKEQVLNVM